MTDAAATWRRLRLKTDPTTDDHDWVGNQVTPNRITAVVGGTTTAGVYSITVTGTVHRTGGGQTPVSFTATITRAAETDAQIASNLNGDFGTGLANGTGSPSLVSLGITSTVSTATLTILFPAGFVGTVTSAAPSPGTITFPLGSTLPICASATHFARGGESAMNGVVVIAYPMDDAGATLLAPGTGTQMTFDMQGVELIELDIPNADGSHTYAQRVGRTVTLTGCIVGNEYVIPLRGAKRWTVRISNDADPTTNIDSLEVIWRDAAT